MNTKLEMCNAALVLAGEKPLLTLAGNESDPRILTINAFWDFTVEEVLRDHSWNCGYTRKKIAQDPTIPDFGYAYRYKLPNDCLRVIKINNDLSAVWKIEGRYLLTDETDCQIEYIRRIENEAEFDAMLKEAIYTKLAYKIAKKITGANESVAINLYKMYQNVIAEARVTDFKESSLEAIDSYTMDYRV
jgi:hypothetical protein